MKSRMNRGIGRNPCVNAFCGANGAGNGDILVRCPFCLKTFQPKSRLNRFCSSRHRLLFWALGEIAEDLKVGEADGLRPRIRELGRAA